MSTRKHFYYTPTILYGTGGLHGAGLGSIFGRIFAKIASKVASKATARAAGKTLAKVITTTARKSKPFLKKAAKKAVIGGLTGLAAKGVEQLATTVEQKATSLGVPRTDAAKYALATKLATLEGTKQLIKTAAKQFPNERERKGRKRKASKTNKIKPKRKKATTLTNNLIEEL